MVRRSLRARLILAFIGLSIIPLFIVGAILGWKSFVLQQHQAIALQREISERAASQISTHLENADNELHLLIQTPGFKTAGPERQQEILAQSLFFKNLFDELALLDRDGRELARATRLGPVAAANLKDRSSSEEFRIPMRRNTSYYGPISFSPLNGEPLMLTSVPTIDATNGQPDGVLVGLARLQQVLDKVAAIQVGQEGTIAVVSNNIVVAYRDPQLVAARTRFTPPASDGLSSGVTGKQAVLTIHPIKPGEQVLYIVAALPVAEALAPALEQAGVTGVLLLVASIVALGLGLRTVRFIVRPISQLADAAQAISNGDLTRQVPVTASDEIGTLQREFDAMVTNLREQRAAIEQRNAELQTSLDTQSQMLRTIAELSTPLLPIWEGVVVLPVVGHVDSLRGQEIINTLVNGVAARRARVAILDITGIAMVDTRVIGLLLQAIRAIELLGAQPILAGISAPMASIIVQQGIDMGALSTHRDLRTATEYAIDLLETVG